MIHQQVARPYARALFTLAQSAGREARVWEDLERVLAVWDGNPAFRAFIRRPEVSKRVKRDVVHRVFASDLDELTRHFLEVLLDKNRETVLGEIASEYRRLWDDARGIRHADVTSAEELGADEKDALTQALARA
ncbi:MAG: ATP synthase F1 subunit delta, partial [Sulfobacillus sp.]|nr:ATP synthase F1 subunit delta [Sulfobacillus sp.]